MSSLILPALGTRTAPAISDGTTIPAGKGFASGRRDFVISSKDTRSADVVESRPPRWGDLWWEPVAARLRELMKRPANWDGEGALPVDADVAEVAISLLHEHVSGTDYVPDLVPLVDGGIELSWRSETRELSVEVRPDGDGRIWFCDDESGEEWETALGQEPRRVGHLVYLVAARP